MKVLSNPQSQNLINPVMVPMLKKLDDLVVFPSSYFLVYSIEALSQLINVSSQFPEESLGRITTLLHI